MKILTAPYVLTMQGPIREKQGVVIDEGLILEIGPVDTLLQKYPKATREDYAQSVLMPGLVNAHSQLEFLSLAQTGKSLSLTEWLILTREHRKKITPVERRTHLLEGMDRLLSAGTTCTADVGDYVGVIPSLAKQPLRMILFPEIFTSAEKTVQTDYEAVFTMVDEIAALDSPHIRPGLSPYAAYTVSGSLLKILSRAAEQQKLPIKIHAAESFAEMQFFFESAGEIAEQLFPALGWDTLPLPHRKTPIQFLDSLQFLGPRTILVGGIHLADGDLQILKKRESKIAFTPRHQAACQFGILPLKKLKQAGIPIGLGTDGLGLQSVSLWDEMRYVLDRPKEYGLSALDLLQMATLEAARVLGMEREIGSLEPKKRADLIAVKLPPKTTSEQLLTTLIQETSEGQIKAVYIDGQKIR